MMSETFETQTISNWKQKAEEALKGKSIDSLLTNTYEGIQLKPLYTKVDIEPKHISQFPGQRDFRRGTNSLGYLTQEWRIAQRMDATEGEDLKEKLLIALEKGQTALAFSVDNISLNEFHQLIEGLYSKYPFSINANNKQIEILKTLLTLPNHDAISGYISSDPLAEAVINDSHLDNVVSENWAEVLKAANESMPNLRTILVNTSIYHCAGANAVQELAIALSTGVYYIDMLLKQGISLEAVLQSMVFKFSIGANFFMEIAKLRAARILWAKIAESYGAKTADQKMIISAETSAFTKTAYDPYVNLLRAGNEAFAAVIGGVQYLHVSPFNEPEGSSTAFSERIARNTQLILKSEAHLQKLADPAGGSWYVESLTNELAEKSWALFLQIEEEGGLIQALKTGWIQEQIGSVFAKRQQDTFNRKKSIIGTNMYANLNDKPLSVQKNKSATALPQVRLSVPFERLRYMAEEIDKLGRTPTVGLICLGELKEHKARMDFVAGLFATGGIHSVNSESIENVDSALRFVKESALHHYVLCGTDKQYDAAAMEITRAINENYPDKKIFLAGLPEKDRQVQLERAGVREFIHLRSNCYEILSTLLSEMEGQKHD